MQRRLTNASIAATPPAQSLDAQTVMQRLFQLTELVYRLNLPNQTSLADALVAVQAFYVQSMDWYEDFFTVLKEDSNRTPLILFTQWVDDNRITTSLMIPAKLTISSAVCTTTIAFSVHFDRSSRNG